MHEEIIGSILGSYESETLLRVEPLNRARGSPTLGHGSSKKRSFWKILFRLWGKLTLNSREKRGVIRPFPMEGMDFVFCHWKQILVSLLAGPILSLLSSSFSLALSKHTLLTPHLTNIFCVFQIIFKLLFFFF